LDPIGTGASVCTGYDMYATRYRRAVVLATSIKVEIYDEGSSNNTIFSLWPTNSTSNSGVTINDIDNLLEVKYS